MMKVCMCPATYKRLLKWARKGGLKGVLNVVRSGVTKRKASQKSRTRSRNSSKNKVQKRKQSSGKIHFMRVPIGPKGKKNRKTRRQAYIIKANGQRKFVKNPK